MELLKVFQDAETMYVFLDTGMLELPAVILDRIPSKKPLTVRDSKAYYMVDRSKLFLEIAKHMDKYITEPKTVKIFLNSETATCHIPEHTYVATRDDANELLERGMDETVYSNPDAFDISIYNYYNWINTLKNKYHV